MIISSRHPTKEVEILRFFPIMDIFYILEEKRASNKGLHIKSPKSKDERVIALQSYIFPPVMIPKITVHTTLSTWSLDSAQTKNLIVIKFYLIRQSDLSPSQSV